MRMALWVVAAMAVLILAGQAHAARIGRPAPDFTGGGPWFNTHGKALSLADLRGKVVAVEIWTAG
jgi:hypothetical protein